jgi:hypothetical protein
MSTRKMTKTRMCVSLQGPFDLANEAQEAMTEEQRMEEGRRMFQIFAARMFEQRVLQAYREKVAAERQKRLLEELAEEDEQKDLKEAKKAKEAQKRKEKKDKQRQAKAEEKAKRDAEIAAKEAEAKAVEEKRLEEQRKKREEQRKKKEAERKAQEEEKQRKEAERQKRQQEERERQQEVERKVREQKALEKKAKDDAKRKEREEREAKEKEAREKKAHDDNQRKERDVKVRADKDRTRKDELVAAVPAPPGARKASQPVAPALPPQLLKQTSSTGIPSPHVTPAIPKAPTPNRPRQTSRQGSHGSSPTTPQVASGTSKSISPTSQAQGNMMPKTILSYTPWWTYFSDASNRTSAWPTRTSRLGYGHGEYAARAQWISRSRVDAAKHDEPPARYAVLLPSAWATTVPWVWTTGYADEPWILYGWPTWTWADAGISWAKCAATFRTTHTAFATRIRVF